MQEFKQSQTQNLKQLQRLILSPQMQQALHLLQLPVCELSSIIADEMTENPILEYVEEEEESSEDKEIEIFQRIEEEFGSLAGGGARHYKTTQDEEDLRNFIERSVAYEKSLYDLLMEQAHQTFVHEEDISAAKAIIGNVDPQGFLTSGLEEISLLYGIALEKLAELLEEIQQFDPPGVGARNLKESLLLQLQRQGKKEQLPYRIVDEHFEDMLHNRLPLIAKALGVTPQKIREAISSEVAKLDLHPGTCQPLGHYKQIVQHITPDVIIHYSDKFTIEVNEESLPPLRINKIYLKMLEDPSLSLETREYIREKIASGKWLLRNLCERHHTLYRITEQLIEHQKDFFSGPKGKLIPLTMKVISEKLELHESTIARAVANKYVSSPRGIFPFRFFFTHAFITDSGEILSSKTVKDLLVDIIAKEERSSPLSDEMISHLIKEQGIPCARRTVAKYRQELGIGNTTQRRSY